MATGEAPAQPTGRLAELRLSARGWHGVQLAVIGFVGLCGVIKRENGSVPTWIEVLSGILVLVALLLACLATYLVGRVAWPLYDPRRRTAMDDDDAGELVRASRRLTRGLLLTFVAVALVALASAGSWWPSKEDAGAAGAAFVEVQAQGSSFCGELADAPDGAVRIVGGDQPVQVSIDAITSIRAVGAC